MRLPTPSRCAHRLFQPPDAFSSPRNRFGFVSLRKRSWGLYPSEAFPHRPPNASRLVVPLLMLLRRTEATFRGLSDRWIRSVSATGEGCGRSILSWASPSPGSSPHLRRDVH